MEKAGEKSRLYSFEDFVQMKEIASQNNRWVKLIRKLKDKKHRDAEKMYVIEGPNLLEDAVKNNEEIIMVGMHSQTEAPSMGLIGADVFRFSREIINSLTDTITPQNVLAVIKKKDATFIDGDNRFVILDGLQDPGNVGTIIRTAEAAGFTGVIAVKGTADIYSPKVVRAAAGSLFRIGIIELDNKEKALEYARKRNLDLYGCDGNAESSYTDVNLRENIGIIVGNEGKGLSLCFQKNSRGISIPMKDETESLNAAVAAGIVIYESVRQRKVQE